MENFLQGVIPVLQNFEMNLMPILFCYISQVIGQCKFDTFTPKMWRKKQGSALRLFFTYLHENLFNIKKHLALSMFFFVYPKLI